MKREDEIDKIFKRDMPASSFENKDALWQRIEKDLDKQPRKKRPLVYLAVLLCLVAGGIFIAKNSGYERQSIAVVKKTQEQKEKITSATEIITGKDIKVNNANGQISHEKKLVLTGAKKTSSVVNAGIIAETDVPAQENDNTLVIDKTEETATLNEIVFEPQLLNTKLNHNTKGKIKSINAPPVLNKFILPVKKKYSVDITGGVNIASFKKSTGFYAGVSLNKNLKNNAAVSAALLYSASNLSEKYMLSGKPDYNKETDAILNKLNMLQLNLQLRQQVKGTKLFLSGGLMPVYILDAAFVNLPSSDSSNPSLYRRFTLKDINRLNVLFAASARYGLTKKVHAEITGTYGLTGLVKDSYINQSNLKGNFRSV